MKKNFFIYAAGLFFMVLLLAKDLLMVFPSFLAPASASLSIDWTEDDAEKSRNSEEVKKGNAGEYLDNDYFQLPARPVFRLSKRKNLPVNSSFKQKFYSTVLTPPPDKG